MKISIHNTNKNWFYTVSEKDEKLDMEKFIKKFNVNKEDFMFLNNETKLELGNVFIIPPSSNCFHIVQPLETLEKISKMFNCTVDHLKEINKIETVFVGQKIYL